MQTSDSVWIHSSRDCGIFPAQQRDENSQHRAITSSRRDPVRSTICDGFYDLCTIDGRSARSAELLSVRRNVMGRWLCGECLSLVQIGGGRMNVLFLSQRAGGYWVTSVVVEGSMMLVTLGVVCDVGSELCVVEGVAGGLVRQLWLIIARDSRRDRPGRLGEFVRLYDPGWSASDVTRLCGIRWIISNLVSRKSYYSYKGIARTESFCSQLLMMQG